jgi:hypothetical protein
MCSFVAPERSSCHSWAVVVAPGYAGYAGWVDWTHQSFRILGATEGMSHKTFLQDPWGGIRWLQLKYATFPWCQLCLSRFSIPFRASVLRFTQFWEVKRLNINGYFEWMNSGKKITPKEIIGSPQVSTAHRSMDRSWFKPAKHSSFG